MFSIFTACPIAFSTYINQNKKDICAKIEKLKVGMDKESKWQVDRYFRIFDILPSDIGPCTLMYPDNMTIFDDEDKFILSNIENLMNFLHKKFSKFDMSEINISINNMYFNNGLTLLPHNIKQRIKHTIALDCGAFVGDSAISYLEYNFYKIYSFEPLKTNYEILLKNIKKNALEEKICAFNYAIDKENKNVFFSGNGQGGHVNNSTNIGECLKAISLDNFFEKNKKEIGLIKIDVEGSELSVLQGAENIIRKYKPVILASIYHTWIDPEQIFNVKNFIENLNLGYKFKFKWMQPEYGMIFEHNLICY